MGTKIYPDPYDCFNSALDDEQTFTLVARDPDFAEVVAYWCAKRMARIATGEKPSTDIARVNQAMQSAYDGAIWRRENMGWRDLASREYGQSADRVKEERGMIMLIVSMLIQPNSDGRLEIRVPMISREACEFSASKMHADVSLKLETRCVSK